MATKISTGENTETVTDKERDENNKTCENDEFCLTLHVI